LARAKGLKRSRGAKGDKNDPARTIKAISQAMTKSQGRQDLQRPPRKSQDPIK